MNHIFSRSLISLLAVALFFLSAPSCLADVLFVHDYKSTEYLMGSQDAELLAGYTDQAMFMDKKARYTGRVMEAFLGKDKEVRETTHFLLDKDQIREIDYYKGKVIVYPLAKLSDTNWIKGKEKLDKDTADMIRERYRTVPPKLSVTIHPQTETIGGYVCRRVEADIRLETIDVKKNSSSVTLVKQKLWVSTKVPGYGEYNAFHRKLAKRLGLDALRVGNLSVSPRLLGRLSGFDPQLLKGGKRLPRKEHYDC